ncbi:MAG: flavin reductase family protein [Mesorhizobium sp.]|uniref:flavin reductase family protein n=1 Tax=unclassified Mesorhizobium TaxID=325217 RepID=UPI000FCCB3AF|nr:MULTISPECIES: flavin reductase family protein [unclassified Mesorhizobium]RUV66778.1 flavin reductase family protein [Mesorhizobium sp. M5C.F.Cr.IN.023.01.1.1]RWF85461.1 MAG: flavin reductase family protein [Mesorhizobium sp.]RWF93459.1 MAG: flavin reductase family protein [Mesorhizobium sp.]RWI34630.1 MAG: flavin reductase family protein [Mesorhizobium sp.]RWI45635.1 MAG: flavin reductase family protein [Mesorhizobium sp.]
MFYEPAKGHGLPHDPSKAIVAPRPIGWISTVSKAGEINLAPYSFFNAFSTRPFIVWFSSEGEKDSAAFAEQTGEFVANLVSRDLAEQMVRTAVDAPRGVTEFVYADLAMAPSRLVAPPRVAAAPAALECRVTEILRPKALDGTLTSAVVVAGEVVGVHIDDAFLNDGMFDIVKAGNVSRLGYMDYASVSEIFSMRRPRWGKD